MATSGRIRSAAARISDLLLDLALRARQRRLVAFFAMSAEQPDHAGIEDARHVVALLQEDAAAGADQDGRGHLARGFGHQIDSLNW